MKKQEFKKKKEEKLRNFQDNFKRSDIQTIGVPKENKSKKLKTYLNSPGWCSSVD